MKGKPTDFLLNTDYELDRIVYFKEGKFKGSISFAHNLSFAPLVFGIWSTDKDFNSVNTFTILDSDPWPAYKPILSVQCTSTIEKINLKSGGNDNNVDLYYRIYAFESDNENKSTPLTSKNAKNFILNTDYNYCKLYKSGVFNSVPASFKHNLGYKPQVLAWYRYSAEIMDPEPATIYPYSHATESKSMGLVVTDTEIKINAGQVAQLAIDKVYWRIYYDES